MVTLREHQPNMRIQSSWRQHTYQEPCGAHVRRRAQRRVGDKRAMALYTLQLTTPTRANRSHVGRQRAVTGILSQGRLSVRARHATCDPCKAKGDAIHRRQIQPLPARYSCTRKSQFLINASNTPGSSAGIACDSRSSTANVALG